MSDLITAAYRAFEAGDIPAVLGALADDIAWHVPGRSKAVDFREFQGDQQSEGEFWSS